MTDCKTVYDFGEVSLISHAQAIELGVHQCPKEAPVRFPSDLDFNGKASAVLVRYENGEQALWLTDEYLAGRSETPGTYTLNDTNTRVAFAGDEDVDAAVEAWKLAVEWDAEVPGDDRTYRVGVVVQGEKSLTYNALRFSTYAEAEAYANDLQSRWTAVTATRIEEVQS